MKSFRNLFRAGHTRFSVFKGFLITYLVIILIFAISCGYTYIQMFHTIDNYEGKNMDAHLEQSQKVLTQRMNEINNLPSQLMQNTAVSTFLNTNIYNINSEFYAPTNSLEIISILANYRSTNSLVDDILLFSPYTNKLIDSYSSFDGTQGYGSLLSLENLTFEGMKNSLLKEYSHNRLIPEMNVIISGEETKDILHITSLSPYSREVNGSCIVFINSEQLIELLQQSYGSENAYVYLYNPDGCLLAKTSGAPDATLDTFAGNKTLNLGGEKYLVRSTQNTNTWNLAIATPYRFTLQDAFHFKRIILYIAFFSVLACVTLAFVFAKFNYLPVRNIFQKLTPESNGAFSHANANEFEAISDAIENLLDSEQSAHDAFEQNLPVLQMNFVQTLLRGEFSSPQEIEDAAQKLRLDIHGKTFAPLLVCVNSANGLADAEHLEQAALAKTVIIQSLSAKARCLYCDYNNGIAAIPCFDNDAAGENLLLIEEAIQTASDLLFASQNIHLISAVGDFCQNLTDIFYSYERAKDYMDNGLQTTLRHNTWCTPNVSGFSWYYYPLEVENKLIHSFLSGNIDGVYEILNAVYEENANTRILSGNMISCLYSDIKATIYKLLAKTNTHELPENINAMLSNTNTVTPMSEFFHIAEDVFAVMDEQNRQESKADISVKILNYVDSAALSPDFGRHSVAEHFYISEEYVSKYFKENTGFNFLEYVTKIKMTTAQQMLLDGNYTVNKIAEAVGYNSAIAFRRAFKAYTGSTPVEWRQQHIK